MSKRPLRVILRLVFLIQASTRLEMEQTSAMTYTTSQAAVITLLASVTAAQSVMLFPGMTL
jgi:hypothetical protein